jgi:outer membrane receptor protein involved in Fe transport
VHDIEQRYKVDDLAASISVPGWEDTIWLTEQQRIDRDYAAFGEVTYEFVDWFSATAGLRYFEAKNTLMGFYGFGLGYSSGTGVGGCATPTSGPFHGAPCTNLDTTVEESGVSPKVNATFQISDDIMMYLTWSRGFRPGGVNRRGSFPPYKADYLNNYEYGWKTSWLDDRVRFNGAVFYQQWDDFQFSFLGPNGLTNVTNAGDAIIYGVESSIEWAATQNLRVSAGASYLKGELDEDFCKNVDASGNQLPRDQCGDNFTPKGTQLPITPRFKGNATGRYEASIGSFDSHFQASVVYTGSSRSALVPADSVFLKDLDASTVVDLSAGVAHGEFAMELYISNATDERVELYRYVQCATQTCGPQPYTVTNQPRTIGLKFGQKF